MKMGDLQWALSELIRAARGLPAHDAAAHDASCEVCGPLPGRRREEAESATGIASRFICEAVDDPPSAKPGAK